MKFIDVEIKAKCFHPAKVEAFLINNNARFAGTDFQKDTYFKIPAGRLKIQQGNIENNLIFYDRNNQEGPKQSHFHLVPVTDPALIRITFGQSTRCKNHCWKEAKNILPQQYKVHIDEVTGLGCFLEIEAGNRFHPELSVETLYRQCPELMLHFDIREEDLIDNSYSDMLLAK